MCKNKTFEEIMNEKVRSYLWNIKNEYIINECELIHCINNECIKKILIHIYVSFRGTIINVVEDLLLKKIKLKKKKKKVSIMSRNLEI